MRRLVVAGAGLLLLVGCGVQNSTPNPSSGFQELIAGGNAPAGREINETPSQWFVEFNEAPLSEGGNAGILSAEQQAFSEVAAQEGLRVRRTYQSLFNGAVVEAAGGLVGKLSALPGVVAVYPVGTVEIPQLQTVEPNLATALSLTGADIAQNELGLTGSGVKVGIIDSGMDLQHPDFSGRIVKGYDFVGDDYDASSPDPAKLTPKPDNNPDDCDGHGTHVGGIVGANGTVKGVAPGVTFGAYKVFGCDGSTSDAIILDALEKAESDGMDIVNMSLGSPFGWPGSPTEKAISRLVRRGVIVVVSAGNNGANGLYAVGGPSTSENVISVASFDNVQVNLKIFTISPDNTRIGFGEGDGGAIPTSGGGEIVATATPTTANDGCAAFAAGSLSGKIALVRRGACNFSAKAFNAQTAGAIAMVLYNNRPGPIGGITVAGAPAPITIPVVTISGEDGAEIFNRLATGPVNLTWTPERVRFPVATGNLLSSFSSHGLSSELTFKPDLGAPGGFIFSTYPLEKGGFASISGTSMSSPHVAGAAALILEGNPSFHGSFQSPTLMRTILQNTAQPKPFALAPAAGVLDSSFRQGAGMIDVVAAVQNKIRVTPSKLALGESEAGPATHTLTIDNNTRNPVTYAVSHEGGASAFGNTFAPSFATGFAEVAFSAASVTVPAFGSAKLTATITANPALPDKGIYGGYIVFKAEGAQTLRVPYAGFKGDYQSLVAIPTDPNNSPAIGFVDAAGDLALADDGQTFTLAGGDLPLLIIHLDHQVRKLRAVIVDVATDQPVHSSKNRAVDIEFMPRNTTPTGIFVFPWDGTRITKVNRGAGDDFGTVLSSKPVPNGSYRLVIKALKALGNENNPAHWETWSSTVIKLARPAAP
jgi:subtilisin family serine protease